MSYDVSIILPESALPRHVYQGFLDECIRIKGEWDIVEHHAFNLNSEETVHECVIVDPQGKYVKPKDLSIWIILYRTDSIKKY